LAGLYAFLTSFFTAKPVASFFAFESIFTLILGGITNSPFFYTFYFKNFIMFALADREFFISLSHYGPHYIPPCVAKVLHNLKIFKYMIYYIY
jgi:hypothetical protein